MRATARLATIAASEKPGRLRWEACCDAGLRGAGGTLIDAGGSAPPRVASGMQVARRPTRQEGRQAVTLCLIGDSIRHNTALSPLIRTAAPQR